MSIRLRCSGCDKLFKLADRLAGKRVRCPECQTVIAVPADPAPPADPPADVEASETADDPYDLQDRGEATDDDGFPAGVEDSAAPAPPRRRVKTRGRLPSTLVESLAPADGTPRLRKPGVKKPSAAPRAPAGWRDHLLWVLLLALAPLAISILMGDAVAERLAETVRQHPEIAQAGSKAEFFAALPEHRLLGAHLPHETWWHWVYAGLSAALFFVWLTRVFPNSGASPARLFWTGVLTGTVGILLLLSFQVLAVVTQGFFLRGRGIVAVLFYIVKFIGFSYRAALNLENGFWASFFGFTCGVGLCEELCKAIPVLIFLRGNTHAGWRAACLVGLASGVGFGVSEGITYSSDSYNGVATGLTYLVRFASCVALHAAWAGAVGLLMSQNQDYLGDGGFDASDAGYFLVYYLSLAMVLHGLYDTLLKKDYELWALSIAAVSFGWLAWLVWRCRSAE